MTAIYERHSPTSPLETHRPLPRLLHAVHLRWVMTSSLGCLATPARSERMSSCLLRATLPCSSTLPGTRDKDSPLAPGASPELGPADRLACPCTSDGVLEERRTAHERNLTILHITEIVASTGWWKEQESSILCSPVHGIVWHMHVRCSRLT